MSRREFTSQKALQDHAEQTGQVCVLEGIALRQRQLSPDQYEIVEVRTSRGVLRTALLIPKERSDARADKAWAKASEDDADGQVKRGHSNLGTERDAILVRE